MGAAGGAITTSLGAILGGAGLGFLGAYGAGKVTGGGLATDIGAGVGGAIGFTFFGPAGALVGSFLGGTIGGGIGKLIGGGEDPNVGGGGLEELRARRAGEISGDVRGTGFAAQAFYNEYVGIYGHEPTEQAIQTNIWRFGEGQDYLAQKAEIQKFHDLGIEMMAAGGMVMPRIGGMTATLAEGGRAEAVIPLDDPSTKRKLADVFSGPSIVINAGTIIADRYSVQKFAEMIDEELYRRRKQGLSVAFD